MPGLQLVATGLVYRNPKPYLRSRHAFHPSLALLPGGGLLCAFDLGEAVESLDYHTCLARSSDAGRTWKWQGPLLQDRPARRASWLVRISRTSDGSLVGLGAHYYRDDPEEGIQNRRTLGLVPMDLFLTRSSDGGVTWSNPERMIPPVPGPCFEICHSILELPDGRWLAPVSTWRGWSGECPGGEKAVVMISGDRGRTWPAWGVSFDGSASGIIHWEQSVVPLGGQSLLAVAWAHDPRTGRNLPTPFAISQDSGLTFSQPQPTGLRGQTCKAMRLPDGRILCVYRRDDRPGLWAHLASLDGTRWIPQADLPLWGTGLHSSGMTGQAHSSEELADLKFGYPSLIQCPDGEIFVAFWCLEGWACNIRWLRLALGET
ncbi:MAG: exo-alpha-sialidase [Planctomycetes bacterium]|nr:exo-alpha-sialidase [Planctomycetota bacterium]